MVATAFSPELSAHLDCNRFVISSNLACDNAANSSLLAVPFGAVSGRLAFREAGGPAALRRTSACFLASCNSRFFFSNCSISCDFPKQQWYARVWCQDLCELVGCHRRGRVCGGTCLFFASSRLFAATSALFLSNISLMSSSFSRLTGRRILPENSKGHAKIESHVKLCHQQIRCNSV